jgi:hypothetical protein
MNENDELFQRVSVQAQRLTQLYVERKPKLFFKRTVDECLKNEREKIRDLKNWYQVHYRTHKIKFLRGTYFDHHTRFLRFQKIPDKYFFEDCTDYYFISHRWLSDKNPDPDATQFLDIKNWISDLPHEVRENWGFWYDYSCLPQKDESGNISEEDTQIFRNGLNLMHSIPLLSSTLILYDSTYVIRSWCMMEIMIATRISPISKIPIPFLNLIKFRHLAIIILVLLKGDDFLDKFTSGDDGTAISYLNSLIFNTINSCESTIENDKNIITSLMYEHFEYNLSYLGLRTQFMTGMLILKEFPLEIVENFFSEFLLYTFDIDLKWTERQTFVAESIVNVDGVTPTDGIFRRQPILKKSNSEIISAKDLHLYKKNDS